MYKSFTRNQAVYLAHSEFYKKLSLQQIAQFQFAEESLCMPFDIFTEAVKKTLGHFVFTHEYATDYDRVKQKLFPNGILSEEDILSFIPSDIRDNIPNPIYE